MGVRGRIVAQEISGSDIKRMRELSRQGLSQKEIGDLYGINYLTARLYIDDEFRLRKNNRRNIKYPGKALIKPARCMRCGNLSNRNGKPIKLEGHHWDDDHGNQQLFLCWQCHRIAEAFDLLDELGLAPLEEYLALKRQEEKSYEERSKDYEEPRTKEMYNLPLSLPPDPVFDTLRNRLKGGSGC